MATATDTRERLFTAAAELTDPAARAAFLDAACAGDAALRAEVEELLRHDAEAGSFLADGAPVERTIDDPSVAERPGAQIGPYKLMEQIGEGGFGLVFVAEQQEPVRRKVALKVIKPGMDTREVLARFAAERQALALMDHPNIARVFDGGATEAGRPYFVMELVRGVPITDYCDQSQLATRERLELFVSVCHAVQHAHQKGIIHRDIKPSNVLVTSHDDRPVVKVIDFGVAKAVGGQLTHQTVYTQFAQMIGTPLYMSPEQAQMTGLDIDTRSDIYSLGVLLYELLTGTTPFDRERLAKAGLDEIRRVIREEEPEKPSTRLSHSGERLPSVAAQRKTEPARLSRLVRGDLDWITMKCLEKERGRRYETANGLAMDVQRYLADEPVLAGPPSAGYWVKKFVRRNKGPVLAAAAMVLLLVAGIVGTTVGLFRARAAERDAVEAQRAEAERAEAERQANAQAQKRLRQIETGTEILAAVFEDLDPRRSETEGRPLAAVLGDRLAKAAEQLEGEAVGDPLLVAKLQSQLGLSLINLGQARRAIPHLEKAHETRARLLGADHPDTLKTSTDLGRAYELAGNAHKAIPILEEAVKALKVRLGADHRKTLAAQCNLAMAHRQVGNYARALALDEDLFRRRTEQFGPNDPDTLLSMNNLACTLRDAGRLDEAIKLLEECVRLQTVQIGEKHPDTLMSSNNLALMLHNAGHRDRAVALYERTYAARKSTLGAEHPETLNSLHNLAAAFMAAGQPDRGIPVGVEAYQLRKAKLGVDHPDTLSSMAGLAKLYLDARKVDQALPLLEECVKLREAKIGVDHPDTIQTVNLLAIAYRRAGRLGDAIPLMERAVKLHRAKLGNDNPTTLVFIYNLADAYWSAGRRDEGMPLYREAAVGMEKDKFRSRFAGQVVNGLATSLDALGQYDQAEPWHRKRAILAKDKSGADSLEYAAFLNLLTRNLLHQSKWPDAEAVARECLAVREAKAPDAWETFSTRTVLGEALSAQSRFADAEPLLLQGYEGMRQRREKIGPDAGARLTEAVNRLVALYERWGKPAEAAAWKEKRPMP